MEIFIAEINMILAVSSSAVVTDIYRSAAFAYRTIKYTVDGETRTTEVHQSTDAFGVAHAVIAHDTDYVGF